MGFRVTNRQSTDNFIQQIFQQREALETVRDRISSGFDIANPSDDPGRAATVVNFQNAIQRLDGHKERIGYAQGFLEHQDGALESAESILLRAKEVASQAANGPLDDNIRRQLSEEVFELRDTLVSLANTKYQGIYVYGGLDDDDPPFDAATAPGYTVPAGPTVPANIRYVFDSTDLGQTSTRQVAVSDDDQVRINTSGDTVFQNGIATLERLGRALAGYRTFPDPSISVTTTGAGTAFTFPADTTEQTAHIVQTIDLIETARNAVVQERSSVGGRLNRMDQALEIIEVVKFNTEKARSSAQDADIYKAATDLTTLENSLQGLFAAGGRINNLSLLDYL